MRSAIRDALGELTQIIEDLDARIRAEDVDPDVYRVLLSAREEAASYVLAGEAIADIKLDRRAAEDMASRGVVRVLDLLRAVD